MTRSFSFELNPGESIDRKVFTFNLNDDFYASHVSAEDRAFRTYLVLTTEYTHTLSGLMTVKNDYGYEYCAYGKRSSRILKIMRLRFPFRANVVERLNDELTGIVRGHQMQSKYYSHTKSIKILFRILREEGFHIGHRAFRNYVRARRCYMSGSKRSSLTKKAMISALGPWLDTECCALSEGSI
jgi:hypothetical protein